MIVAEVILWIILLYAICGLAVGLPFVFRGVDRIDPSARGAGVVFRLLLLPGSVALWPLLASKWINSRKTKGQA